MAPIVAKFPVHSKDVKAEQTKTGCSGEQVAESEMSPGVETVPPGFIATLLGPCLYARFFSRTVPTVPSGSTLVPEGEPYAPPISTESEDDDHHQEWSRRLYDPDVEALSVLMEYETDEAQSDNEEEQISQVALPRIYQEEAVLQATVAVEDAILIAPLSCVTDRYPSVDDKIEVEDLVVRLVADVDRESIVSMVLTDVLDMVVSSQQWEDEIITLRSENLHLRQRNDSLTTESTALADRLAQLQVNFTQEVENGITIAHELSTMRDVNTEALIRLQTAHETIRDVTRAKDAQTVELLEARTRNAEHENSVKECNLRISKLEMANSRLREQTSSAVAALQEEMANVRTREAESALALNDLRQRLFEHEQQSNTAPSRRDNEEIVEALMGEIVAMIHLEDDVSIVVSNMLETVIDNQHSEEHTRGIKRQCNPHPDASSAKRFRPSTSRPEDAADRPSTSRQANSEVAHELHMAPNIGWDNGLSDVGEDEEMEEEEEPQQAPPASPLQAPVVAAVLPVPIVVAVPPQAALVPAVPVLQLMPPVLPQPVPVAAAPTPVPIVVFGPPAAAPGPVLLPVPPVLPPPVPPPPRVWALAQVWMGWENSEVKVLLLHLSLASNALNLVEANHVFLVAG